MSSILLVDTRRPPHRPSQHITLALTLTLTTILTLTLTLTPTLTLTLPPEACFVAVLGNTLIAVLWEAL